MRFAGCGGGLRIVDFVGSEKISGLVRKQVNHRAFEVEGSLGRGTGTGDPVPQSVLSPEVMRAITRAISG